jgi:hypothetical protein
MDAATAVLAVRPFAYRCAIAASVEAWWQALPAAVSHVPRYRLCSDRAQTGAMRWLPAHSSPVTARCDRGQDALQGASAHAAPCHGLRAGKQGHRHSDIASVPGPSLDPEHGQIHRTGAGPLQELVAMTPASVSAQRCAEEADALGPCPLYTRKRTCAVQNGMSALGQ